MSAGVAKVRVLYDGWPLVYRPDSPAALHLVDLLRRRPREVEALAALPGEPVFPLPEGVEGLLHPLPDHASARLAWEQRILPGFLRQTAAGLLHSAARRPPLFSSRRVLLSLEECCGCEQKPSGLAGRLGEAMAVGGLARGLQALWPEDLPDPEMGFRGKVLRIPPGVPEEFRDRAKGSGLPDLPGSFVLYHGPGSAQSLSALFSAWSWVIPGLGDSCPLLIAGLSRESREIASALISEYGLSGTVILLPVLGVGRLAAVYRASDAVFHPAASTPWAGAVRLALACGKPLVALEDSISSVMTGPAAYLIPASARPGETSRLLGAALLSVLVEEELSAALAAAAALRSAAWSPPDFSSRLGAAYSQIVHP